MSPSANQLTIAVDLEKGVVMVRVAHPLELEPKEAVVSIVDFRSAQITLAVMQQQRAMMMAQQLAAVANGAGS